MVARRVAAVRDARHLTHVFSTGIKPVFRLTLASGKTIRATENHPFLTYGGWRALGDIHAGDAVAVPQHVPAPRECQPVTQDAIDNWISTASRGLNCLTGLLRTKADDP